MVMDRFDEQSGTGGSGRRPVRLSILLCLVGVLLSLTACSPLYHQAALQDRSGDPARKVEAPSTQVYFYPKADQSTEQQSRDHYECYNWAIQQTRFDPSALPVSMEQRVRVVPMPAPGYDTAYDTAALAVAGAVLGALVAGPRHAAGGALVGAGIGAVAGAASDSARQESARQAAEDYRDQAADSQLSKKAADFRRAMSVCLEGRGYSVQ